MQDIEIETVPREDILHELTHGEPYLPVTAIRLGDNWFSFVNDALTLRVQRGPAKGNDAVIQRSFISFHFIGLWTNDHAIRKWPTNHPDDVAKLTSLIFAAIVEGEL